MKAVVVNEPGTSASKTYPSPRPVQKTSRQGRRLWHLRHRHPHHRRRVPADNLPDHHRARIRRHGRRVGAEVVGIAAGDRVGVDPTLNCGECYFCQRGQGESLRALERGRRRPSPGGFAEYVAVPERASIDSRTVCRFAGRRIDRAGELRRPRLPPAHPSPATGT